jgi:hypothetical protein
LKNVPLHFTNIDRPGYAGSSARRGLGVLQIGGVEALGEPVVDVGEHRARPITAALLVEHAGEAYRCAQFPRLRLHLLCECDRIAEVGMGQFSLAKIEPQLSASIVDLEPMIEVFYNGYP